MQREIGDKIQLGDTLNPLNDVSAVQAVDNVSILKDMFGKISKLGDLWEKGKTDASIIRYLPGVSEVLRQGKIFNIVPKTVYASSSTYTDKKTLEFTVELAANTYTNYSMMTLVLPIYFKKSTHKNADVGIVTVNNFFACWLKEIDIRRYRDDVRILPTNNRVVVCNYAAQLKHLPTKSLDDIKETILYEEKAVA